MGNIMGLVAPSEVRVQRGRIASAWITKIDMTAIWIVVGHSNCVEGFFACCVDNSCSAVSGLVGSWEDGRLQKNAVLETAS